MCEYKYAVYHTKKDGKKYYLHFVLLSHYQPHKHISFLFVLGNRNLRKGGMKKKRETIVVMYKWEGEIDIKEEILKNFEGTSLSVSLSLDLFFQFLLYFFLYHQKIFFPISLVYVWPLVSCDTNFKIIQNTKNLDKKIFKIIKKIKSFSK